MRHLTEGEKSVLTGDAVADLLTRYAALLIQQHSADTIDLHAYDSNGANSTVTLLISEGISLVAETTPSDLPEPDNSHVEEYLQTRIDALIREQEPSYDDLAGTHIWNQQHD